MHFGKNLRYLRHKNGMSQEFIADKLGYKNYTTIQKWESDMSEPSIEKLNILANMFNLTMDELVNHDLTQAEDSIYGNHQDNLDYFANKPELLELYKEIYNSESLQLLFDSAKDLTPEALESVLLIIESIKKGGTR
ncbi:helix-turn-helix transcriptional regulator [Erysipelothrix sp. HDW6A]|uniref:helix-turn-helix domain-containing protein n=1 Tax=Erysipelothrix sp. HDW6A TaxID=2714928 RepID=UPI001409BB51|nr:helix-turn-helix transcriptional regulator [Erysipelothrix sp. HDW6A]QIK57802.1 helix-turn-helix transcriptional regulator [Erysipelothrix sp. HDW6A]